MPASLPPFRPALLAFDLDGTLIPEQERNLSAETSTILGELRALDVKLAVITGRDVVTKHLRQEAHLDADAANNGGIIHVAGESRYEEFLDAEDVERLLQHGLTPLADAEYPPAFAFSAKGHAVPDDGATRREWMEKHRVSFLSDEHRNTAYKVLYSHPDAGAYAEHLRATQPHLVVTGGMEPYAHFVSVTPKNATKSTALRRIAEALGVPLAQTIAFGDSDNDADMLEAAGFAVQIGNHPHLTPHADVTLAEQGELDGYLRRLAEYLRD